MFAMKDIQWLELQNEFNREMLALPEATREFGYNPSYFLRMVKKDGGLLAAKKLITKPTISDGLKKLQQAGRLDLSVEATVLKEKYKPLFTDAERQTCLEILGQLGYTPE